MSVRKELLAFANAVRQAPVKGAEDADTQRRMAIYRTLFFNNIVGFISNGFPVLCSLYCAADWQALIREFFTRHACKSPYFIDISKEFITFLSNDYTPQPRDPVFLNELAHYEWLELDLSVRQAEHIDYWCKDSLPELVTVSPLIALAAYPYLVHQISLDYQPQQPGAMQYYLLYRDLNHEIQFQHLAPLSALVIDILQGQAAIPVDALIQQICAQVPDMSIESVSNGIRPLISQWLSCGVVVAVA